jgi:predicted anti-sigma-YlaC factor YlaD
MWHGYSSLGIVIVFEVTNLAIPPIDYCLLTTTNVHHVLYSWVHLDLFWCEECELCVAMGWAADWPSYDAGLLCSELVFLGVIWVYNTQYLLDVCHVAGDSLKRRTYEVCLRKWGVLVSWWALFHWLTYVPGDERTTVEREQFSCAMMYMV